MTETNRPTEDERRESIRQMGMAEGALADAVDAHFWKPNEETQRELDKARAFGDRWNVERNTY